LPTLCGSVCAESREAQDYDNGKAFHGVPPFLPLDARSALYPESAAQSDNGHKRGDTTPTLRATTDNSQPANRDIRAMTSGRFSANKARYFGLNQR
jgi:hypothetical protein